MTDVANFNPTIEKRLTEIARERRPWADNWWREQRYGNRKMVHCLVCGVPVTGWPAKRQRPRAADWDLWQHYLRHAPGVAYR